MADEKDEKAASKAADKKEKQAKKAAGADGKGKAAKPREKSVFEPIKIQLKERYKTEMVPALIKELGLKGRMQVPNLKKIVINLSTAEAVKNP
ncbi:MAG: 50S ribosomal protein L5, partial [Bdellovibrionales bacterium]